MLLFSETSVYTSTKKETLFTHSLTVPRFVHELARETLVGQTCSASHELLFWTKKRRKKKRKSAQHRSKCCQCRSERKLRQLGIGPPLFKASDYESAMPRISPFFLLRSGSYITPERIAYRLVSTPTILLLLPCTEFNAVRLEQSWIMFLHQYITILMHYIAKI